MPTDSTWISGWPDAFTGGLAALFAMCAVSNGLLPFPVTATTLWLGQFGHPLWVVAAGTLGSVVGWVFVAPALSGWFAKKQTRRHVPAWLERYLGRHLLWGLFLNNALPLPVDLFRYLSALDQRPLPKVLWVLAAGRAVRSALLVYFGQWLSSHPALLWSVIGVYIAIPAGLALRDRLRAKNHP